MDITRLTFVARKRSSWDIFDLTQLLVKKNFISMMKIMLLMYMPLALISWSLFSASTAMFILWWVKPLLERPLLDFLAKESFAQPTTSWSCIRSIKVLSWKDIFVMLTIRRFSPNRAYLAPIEQLEKLKGIPRNKRKDVLLHRNKHKQTFWLIFCVHIEFLLTLLFLWVAFSFIPEGIKIDDQFILPNFSMESFEQIYFFSYLAAIQLIAPFFVTGGFLAYINGRINLEGWDLELAFKQIANRFTQFVLAILMVATTSFFDSSPVFAAEPASGVSEEINAKLNKNKLNQSELNKSELNKSELNKNKLNKNNSNKSKQNNSKQEKALTSIEKTRNEVAKIYQDNELVKKAIIWQPVNKEEKSDLNLDWLKDFFKQFNGFGNVIGYVFWILLIALIVWGVFKLYSYGGGTWFKSRSPQNDDKKTEVKTSLPIFFESIAENTWPEDLLRAAEHANTEGKCRKALMYLLKFSFDFAEQHSAVVIHASMSEKECEKALIKALPKNLHPQYKQLFFVWVQQAWAHKNATKEQVIDLISSFRHTELAEVER